MSPCAHECRVDGCAACALVGDDVDIVEWWDVAEATRDAGEIDRLRAAYQDRWERVAFF